MLLGFAEAPTDHVEDCPMRKAQRTQNIAAVINKRVTRVVDNSNAKCAVSLFSVALRKEARKSVIT